MKLRRKTILKFLAKCCWQKMLTVFFVFAMLNAAKAQQNDAQKRDTTAKTNPPENLEAKLGIRISKDALPNVVNAKATDSAVLNLHNNVFQLYGDAEVTHEDLKLNASKISYNQATSTVTAQPLYDSAGQISKRPTFTQASDVVTYDSLQYNFKSKKAVIRNARSQYGDGFVISKQVKKSPDQSIYGWKSIYTTCALDTPHFGIRANRIKVVPEKVIASASANIEIEGVPTPIFLPFGLFPITQKQRSGFMLPSYSIEELRGLGLTNGGYYFHFNDYIDMQVNANIYTKGSYNVSGISRYSNRYRYSGGFSLSYANNKTGESYEPGAYIKKDFSIQWQHRTDAKARPGQSFSANVNIASSSFNSLNSYNYNSILQNQLSSSISYSKNWTKRPMSLTVAANHSQNLSTHEIRLSVPEVSFFLSQFNPFQRKNRIGLPKWYEKITASYSSNLHNQTVTNDTAFNLAKISLNDFKNGIKHSIPISASYNALKYFNVSFNTTLSEYWLTEKLTRAYNDTTGKIDTVHSHGFYTARDFSFGVSVNTRIYGLKKFKKGKLMGIRHVISPSIGANYVPDFAAAPFNYYYRTRLDTSSRMVYESPYASSIIGTPGMGQYGKFASNINFGINNNLQIKVRSKNDTTGKGRNVTLIDGLSITGSYNVAADSFKWSTINTSFHTNIANKLNVSANASFDPYDRDSLTGRRLKYTMMDDGRGLARFTSGSISLGANFKSKDKSSKHSDPTIYTDEYNLLMGNGGYFKYIDFNIPWSLNFSYSARISKQFSTPTKRDTLVFDHNLMFNGDFNLTPRWKIAFNSGYNFFTHSLVMTSIDIYRDMHCWEMRMNMIPFGPRKSYTFTLNVKASVLQDLRLIRRRSFYDLAQ